MDKTPVDGGSKPRKQAKPPAAMQRRADYFIWLLKAYKNGETNFQRKTSLSEWHDIDLGDYIKASAVCYRIKGCPSPRKTNTNAVKRKRK